MPSGGGSAGGGGGGGGGGVYTCREENFRSHWSSSRQYSFGNSGFGTGTGGGWEDLECKCSRSCFLYVLFGVVLFLVFGLIGIGVPVGLRISERQRVESNIATNYYSPGDSRLLSFSSFFCERVRIGVESTLNTTGAEFFIVDSTPLLTDQNNFTIINSNVSLAETSFHFWQYHLYPGSRVSMDVCISCRGGVDVYVVKGNSNVNQWGDDPGSDHVELYEFVFATCPNKEPITFTAVEEDEYYFIMHNSFRFSERCYDIILTFERLEYEPPRTGDCCAIASGDNCALFIPYGTGSQQILVVTTIPEDVDWDEKVEINTSCDRRDWAYAVVILVPLLLVTTVVVVVLSIYCYRRVKSNEFWKRYTIYLNNLNSVDNASSNASAAVLSTDLDTVDEVDALHSTDFDKVDKIDSTDNDTVDKVDPCNHNCL